MATRKSTPSWLELLLRDAPAAELDALRAKAADNDAQAEAGRALQLHFLLRERAQRAAEMSSLSEIAISLTSVRDLASLLSDITVHARRLLRTDVTYIAVLEGETSLRIRYWDGTLGAKFRDIQLSMTTGLAGRIATSGTAMWTSDYLGDDTIEHAPASDEVASEEQLRSILGVPLHVHGRTLGVLFAAERSQRPFSDNEVQLLTGLASHAAIAMENARLFDAERASSNELREVNERLRTSAAAVDRAVDLHERLMATVVRGGGPAEVVQALIDVLGEPVELVGAEDEHLAGARLESPSAATAFNEVAERRTTVLDDASGQPFVLCPVIARDEYLGCLIATGPGADVSGIRLLERGALGIALSLVQERALTEAAARSQGELLAALIEGGEPEVLQRQAAAARVNLAKAHRIVVVEATEGHATAARGACAELAQRTGGLVVDRAGRSVLLVPDGTDLSGLTRNATAGVSKPFVGAVNAPDAFSSARRCLQALLALGRTGVVGDAGTLGVYRFLLSSDGAGEAAEFVERSIGQLLEHDAARGTELTATLEEYLSSGRQHSATAERLHIHPNTLYQRLTRIGAILGDDWREPDVALDLHVALRLHRLSASL